MNDNISTTLVSPTRLTPPKMIRNTGMISPDSNLYNKYERTRTARYTYVMAIMGSYLRLANFCPSDCRSLRLNHQILPAVALYEVADEWDIDDIPIRHVKILLDRISKAKIAIVKTIEVSKVELFFCVSVRLPPNGVPRFLGISA